MLGLLSGRTHQVITGVCLVAADFERVDAEITQVTFTAISDAETADYIATGEPMDKAGAYGIQGMASPLGRTHRGLTTSMWWDFRLRGYTEC